MILGYQQREMTGMTVSSPTLSRLGKMLTHQWTAFNHAALECAAKRAFLQGDGHEMQDSELIYAGALDEIACAMVPLGSALQVAKAACGLGNAPRSWWLSVDRFLTSHNGRRTRTDPTIWCFSTDGLGTTHALVAAYVDHFIIPWFSWP